MEDLRWLALLVSVLICLRQIGTELPMELKGFETCSLFEVQEYFELFTSHLADAAVRATLLAVLVEDRHGKLPWFCLAHSSSVLSALLLSEMARLKRSSAVQDLSLRHSRLLTKAFGPLSHWPRLPVDLPDQVARLQHQARFTSCLPQSLFPMTREARVPADIFHDPLDWAALATDEDLLRQLSCPQNLNPKP